MTTYEPRGHSAANPGLRGHSCGDWYPYTVIGVSERGVLSWAAFDCRSGRIGNVQRSYQEALLDVVGLKIRNLINE